MFAPSSARTSRRREVGLVGWTAGVSFVAAALLIAGCGSVTSSKSTGTPPKLPIGDGANGNAAAGAVTDGAMAPAAAVPGPVRGELAIFGGYVLAGPLPTEPTHAPVWQWTSGQASKSDAVHLAAAFALVGTPERHAYGWEVTGPTGDLRVSDAAGHSWSFNRDNGGPCPMNQVDIDDPNGDMTGCAYSVPASSVPAQGPDEAATKAAAASLLSALDVSGPEAVDLGSPSSELTVSPIVGGLQTQGIETTVDVDATGIVGANGTLDAPSAGDDYPLRSAKTAFGQLNLRPQPMIARYCGPMPGGPIRMSGTDPLPPSATTDLPVPNTVATVNPGGPMVPASPPPSDMGAPPVPASPLEPTPPADSSVPVTVSPIPCPTPSPVKITGATLGLELVGDASPDGSPLLVPAWFFATADSSNTVTAIAISEAFLEGPTPPPVPDASAGEASSSPGSVGSGVIAFPPAVGSPAS